MVIGYYYRCARVYTGNVICIVRYIHLNSNSPIWIVIFITRRVENRLISLCQLFAVKIQEFK